MAFELGLFGLELSLTFPFFLLSAMVPIRSLVSPILVSSGMALAQLWTSFQVKETISPPLGWIRHGVPSPDHEVVLRIGLPQSDFRSLENHLHEISHPDHPRYGNHLSREQVERLVAPAQASLDLVDEWLRSFGFQESDFTRSAPKDWLTLVVPLSLAETMLDTKYYIWKHAESGDFLVRTTSYSLPESLISHVDLIQPTTTFGRFKASKSTIVHLGNTEGVIKAPELPVMYTSTGLAVDSSCNTTITIRCLQQLYNTIGYKPSAKNNSVGVTGFLEQYANKKDLQLFYADQRPDALGTSFKFISVHGGINIQNASKAGDEANLDVQFAFGLAHPVPGMFFSTTGRPPFKPDMATSTNTNEPYLDWLDFVLHHPNPPLTISTSYGDNEQTVPASLAQRICAGFAQLGARGVSLVFSSGDAGVGDSNANPADHECYNNDGPKVAKFLPLFPASCPYVTTVGGTTYINPEVAVARFYSGGGFSNYFKRPAYQNQIVKQYLRTVPKGTYVGLFNRTGRAYPDVSAQSDRFRIFLNRKPVLIGGTSASAPTFAAVVALLNDVRLSHGLPPLGFLNPLLYSKASSGLTDVTRGHNAGCGTKGFNATIGWDPVTGLGTPNFKKLSKLVIEACTK